MIMFKLFRRFIAVASYVFRFYVQKFQRLIPHPRLRAFFFKAMGASIGRMVRMEDLVIENQGSWGFNNLKIGDYSVVTHTAKLELTSKIFIGQKCAIGGTIYTHQDAGTLLFDSPTTRRYPRKVAPVIIGNNVWIAADSIILCGVEIGENAIVAAGSLVTHDVPPNTLVAGVPAEVKKKLT